MIGIKFDATNLKKHLTIKGIKYQTLSYLLEKHGEPTSLPTIKKWFVKTNPITPSLKKIKVLSEILQIPITELVKQDIFETHNEICIQNCDIDNEKFNTKIFKDFLLLYGDYGKDELLLPIIEKLRKVKQILES